MHSRSINQRMITAKRHITADRERHITADRERHITADRERHEAAEPQKVGSGMESISTAIKSDGITKIAKRRGAKKNAPIATHKLLTIHLSQKDD